MFKVLNKLLAGSMYCVSVEGDISLLKNGLILTDDIESYQNPDVYRWAIVERSSNKNIGQIAFCKVYSDCRTAECHIINSGKIMM